MPKLLIFAGGTVGSYLGWWLGGLVMGSLGALLFSTVLGCLGIYYGWKLASRFF